MHVGMSAQSADFSDKIKMHDKAEEREREREGRPVDETRTCRDRRKICIRTSVAATPMRDAPQPKTIKDLSPDPA